MEDYSEDFWQWIDEHAHESVDRLRLRWHGKMPWADDAITHLECRHKALGKLYSEADAHEWNRFLMLLPLSVEQCTSPRVARLHCSLLEGYDKVLDMTCGMGIDTMHIARAGHSVTTVEMNDRLARAARYNFARFDNIEVVEGDSVEFLHGTDWVWDAIFVDPARRGSGGRRLFGMHDCSPDVIDLLPEMRRHARRVVAKLSPMLDVTQTMRDLPGIQTLYVVADGGECKEVVAVVDLQSTELTGNITNVPIVVWSENLEFRFTQAEEQQSAVEYRVPVAGDYLYEPWAATMKAGPFRTLAARHGMQGVAANTHLYVSTAVAADFPGRGRRVLEVIPFSSSVAKTFAKRYERADVAVRNFPLKADELQRKLRIGQGGDVRVVGITACDGKRYLVVCEQQAV